MPNNQWNYLLEGLTKGATSFASGLNEKAQKDQAEDAFKKGMNYLESMGVKQQTALNDAIKLNATEDTPEGLQNIKGSMQTTQPPENIVNELPYILANLRSNKYGEPYAQTLEGIYGGMNRKPKYEIINTKNNNLVTIDPYNPKDKITLEEATPKTVQWKPVKDSKSFAEEKDGKYFVTQLKENPETNETKLIKSELTKEEYDYWKLYNPTFNEKEDKKLENKINFRIVMPSGSRSSKRGGTKEQIKNGTDDVFKILNQAKKIYVNTGTIPTSDLQSLLSNYDIDISSLTADEGRLLFEKFSKMTDRQIKSYIQKAYFDE